MARRRACPLAALAAVLRAAPSEIATQPEKSRKAGKVEEGRKSRGKECQLPSGALCRAEPRIGAPAPTAQACARFPRSYSPARPSASDLMPWPMPKARPSASSMLSGPHPAPLASCAPSCWRSSAACCCGPRPRSRCRSTRCRSPCRPRRVPAGHRLSARASRWRRCCSISPRVPSGLPVFAGTPERGIGLAYILGPTGGYILSLPPAAAHHRLGRRALAPLAGHRARPCSPRSLAIYTPGCRRGWPPSSAGQGGEPGRAAVPPGRPAQARPGGRWRSAGRAAPRLAG